MKKILFAIMTLVVVSGCFAQEIERKVLFTMEKNEELLYCYTHYKGNEHSRIDSVKFEAIVIDENRHNQTLILNNQRVVTGDGACSSINIIFRDSLLSSLDQYYISYYKSDEGWYYQTPTYTYGPYIGFYPFYNTQYFTFNKMDNSEPMLSIHSIECSYGLEDYLPYREKFAFDDGGLSYVHDMDGLIYCIGGYSNLSIYSRDVIGNSRFFFQSPNKKHTLLLSGDKCSITMDGKHISLFSTLPQIRYDRQEYKPEIVDVCVFDEGDAIVEYYCYFYRDEIVGGPYKNTFAVFYIDKQGIVQKLEDLQYFDIKDKSIKTFSSDKKQYSLSTIGYNIADSYFDTIAQDILHSSFKIFQPSADIKLDWGDFDDSEKELELENWMCKKKYISNYEASSEGIIYYSENIIQYIQDTSKKHNVLAVRGTGYIYIDDIGVKSVFPKWIIYNPIVNAFRWICVEGRDIVYYSYSLNK